MAVVTEGALEAVAKKQALKNRTKHDENLLLKEAEISDKQPLLRKAHIEK